MKMTWLTYTGFRMSRVCLLSTLFGTAGRSGSRICWKQLCGHTFPVTAAEAARWEMWLADWPIQEGSLSLSSPVCLPSHLTNTQTRKHTNTHTSTQWKLCSVGNPERSLSKLEWQSTMNCQAGSSHYVTRCVLTIFSIHSWKLFCVFQTLKTLNVQNNFYSAVTQEPTVVGPKLAKSKYINK